MSSLASAQELDGPEGFGGSLTNLVPVVGSPKKFWRETVFPFPFFLPFLEGPRANTERGCNNQHVGSHCQQ